MTRIAISDPRCDKDSDFRPKMWQAYRFQTQDVTSIPISDPRCDKHTDFRPKMWQAYRFQTQDRTSLVKNWYACHIFGLILVCLSRLWSEISRLVTSLSDIGLLVTSLVWNRYACHIFSLKSVHVSHLWSEIGTWPLRQLTESELGDTRSLFACNIIKLPKCWQRWDSNPRLRRDWCLKPAP